MKEGYVNTPRLVRILAAALATASMLAAAPALPAGSFAAPAAESAGAQAPAEKQHSWLLGWRDPGQRIALPGTIVLHHRAEPAVELVAPEPGADPAAWLARLRATPGVAYVHPNESVRVLDARPAPAPLACPRALGSASPPQAAPLACPRALGSASPPQAAPLACPRALGSASPPQAAPLACPRALGSASPPQAAPLTGPRALGSASPPQAAPLTGPRALGFAPLAATLAAAPSAAPSDPGLSKQAYLKQIGAREAWSKVRPQSSVTIAVVDTGIDLNHPDLKPNLLQGVNLQNPGSPAQDDNGHGTSVAGVIAASGNNAAGITGVLWKARLLPVKALDEDGYGDEKQLGEGILKAIEKGARIVVLSVGLYHSSPYMREIVDLAEKKGVLLVAATGNDAERFGSKTTIKYPAAYPTVLSVGGIGPDGIPEPRSSRGSEIDLAGAWRVYTTEMGGSYHYEEGTSMAAPQAAAAAALLWAKYPDLKPYQIRSLLRQTTKDTAPGGFDVVTGYGLLRMERALTEKYKPDPHEPNSSSAQAAAMPLGKQLSAELNGTSDSDWYRLDSPYDGVVTLQLRQLLSNGQSPKTIELLLEQPGGNIKKELKLSNHNVEWNVKKGVNRLRLRLKGSAAKSKLPYLLSTSLRMKADSSEPNDRSTEAASLPDRTQSLRGTLHKLGDKDWYSIRVEAEGLLRIQLDAGTMRMDPAFAYRKAGGTEAEVDYEGEGTAETSPQIRVSPGIYYIRVWDASEPLASYAAGFYTLGITREKLPKAKGD
ncbi:Subtilase family protein [Paenibacillaceae bacterium GAS479]|nr:Subtilase family protein [Paenibacillaceae bacterium GAS479]